MLVTKLPEVILANALMALLYEELAGRPLNRERWHFRTSAGCGLPWLTSNRILYWVTLHCDPSDPLQVHMWPTQPPTPNRVLQKGSSRHFKKAKPGNEPPAFLKMPTCIRPQAGDVFRQSTSPMATKTQGGSNWPQWLATFKVTPVVDFMAYRTFRMGPNQSHDKLSPWPYTLGLL